MFLRTPCTQATQANIVMQNCICPMAELVTASDCYSMITSEGREFEPHWGSGFFAPFAKKCRSNTLANTTILLTKFYCNSIIVLLRQKLLYCHINKILDCKIVYKNVTAPVRLELTTFRLTVGRCDQLSHGARASYCLQWNFELSKSSRMLLPDPQHQVEQMRIT